MCFDFNVVSALRPATSSVHGQIAGRVAYRFVRPNSNGLYPLNLSLCGVCSAVYLANFCGYVQITWPAVEG